MVKREEEIKEDGSKALIASLATEMETDIILAGSLLIYKKCL